MSRVRSFQSDPLHSAAYLRNLAKFLHKPNQKPRNSRRPDQQRYQPEILAKEGCRPFIYEYVFSTREEPRLTTFDNVDKYKQTICDDAYSADRNELVFLAGRPSPEWLSAVGARYKLDYRFIHQHLSFLPTGQRDWFTSPTLPSRSHDVLRLCVPSILFIGEHRYVDVNDLQESRGDSERQLRHCFRSLQEGTLAEAGRSIVRRMNIHSGDSLVIEQEISCCHLERGGNWTGILFDVITPSQLNRIVVLAWTDSGQDDTFDFLPVPTNDCFKGSADRLDCCPVFFEKDLSEKPCASEPQDCMQNPKIKQPLSSLPANYGNTIDWKKAAFNPLFAVQELFTFHAASELQYLNMLEQFILDQISEAESTQVKTDICSILHFDYARSILTRHDTHIHSLVSSLEKGLKRWKEPVSDIQPHNNEDLRSMLQTDLGYLSTRIQNIISLCEAGRSTLMSQVSIEETKRSNERAVLVTELTKTTNRLTFIFLPISFVTSAFGMNFKQFGQGTLSVWLWVAITLPLLVACVVLVEKGNYIKKRLLYFVKKPKENT